MKSDMLGLIVLAGFSVLLGSIATNPYVRITFGAIAFLSAVGLIVGLMIENIKIIKDSQRQKKFNQNIIKEVSHNREKETQDD